MESFAAYVALCERRSVVARLSELGRERRTSWRDREIGDLTLFLREVDGMIARHRETARQGGH